MFYRALIHTKPFSWKTCEMGQKHLKAWKVNMGDLYTRNWIFTLKIASNSQTKKVKKIKDMVNKPQSYF